MNGNVPRSPELSAHAYQEPLQRTASAPDRTTEHTLTSAGTENSRYWYRYSVNARCLPVIIRAAADDRYRIWLTELSGALSADSQLHGFDVSGDQYPRKEWLPENVSLHLQDAFAPFADEFLGSFDVVNIRFFITLLNGNNVQPLLSNLKTLLKPGGFLHWLDLDPRSARPICAGPSVRMPQTENVATLMRKVPPDLDLWFSNGGDLLERGGLNLVTYERILLRDHLRPLWNDCYIMGMEDLARRMSSNTNGDNKSPSPLEQQIEALGSELSQGTSIDVQWFLAVGRMPEE
ncbi:hypothetical protein G7054_g9081 [Neopestalotiopsis clavispora]|nr:hypothetical protein G7054_g9081 [Neopestalotiopsis clavispora]